MKRIKLLEVRSELGAGTRGAGMTLELEPTEDILAEVGARARELAAE